MPPSTLRAELAPADELLARALEPRSRSSARASAGAFARELRARSCVARRRRPSPTAHAGSPTPCCRAARVRGAKTRGVVFRSVTRALGVRDGRAAARCARRATTPSSRARSPTPRRSRGCRPICSPSCSRSRRSTSSRDSAPARPRYRPRHRARVVSPVLSGERGDPGPGAHAVGDPQRVEPLPELGHGHQHADPRATETVVRITGTPRNPELCAWTDGHARAARRAVGRPRRSRSITRPARRATTTPACSASLAARRRERWRRAQNIAGVDQQRELASGSWSSPLLFDRKPSASQSRAMPSSSSCGTAENSTTGHVRRLVARLEHPAQLEARDAGHVDVGQDDVGAPVAEHGPRACRRRPRCERRSRRAAARRPRSAG